MLGKRGSPLRRGNPSGAYTSATSDSTAVSEAAMSRGRHPLPILIRRLPSCSEPPCL